MGYLYLALATIGFTLLGLTYKWSDRSSCDKRQVNAFFLSTAAVVMLLWLVSVGAPSGSSPAVVIGAVTGITVFLTVVSFREAAARGPISVSFTVVNLSLVVPVVTAVFLWKEIPSLRHTAGLVLTLVAVVLLGLDIARGHK